MTELRKRFQGLGEDLDRVDVPDLWDEAQRREPRSSTEVAGYPRTRKVVVIATAFALTIATTGIVIRAFHGRTNIRPVSGSPTDWPTGSIPQLGLSFRYPPEWRLQPFNENLAGGFVGVLISDTDLVFHHPPVHNGATSGWDMRGLPDDGVAISIEHISGPPLMNARKPADAPLPLDLSEARIVPHLTKTSFTPPPGRSEEHFLSFVLNGNGDDVRVFFGPHASAQSRKAAAEVVASIVRTDPASPLTWPPVTHSSHLPVSRDASRACSTKRARLAVYPRNTPPGSTVIVSGPVYYRDKGGRFVWYAGEHPRPDYQAWWGLDPKDYASVATKALSIAKGRPYEPAGSGPQMLGDDVPNGACSFSLRFTVPDVAAGTYPVSIVMTGGRGSTTYGRFSMTVTPGTPTPSDSLGQSTATPASTSLVPIPRNTPPGP